MRCRVMGSVLLGLLSVVAAACGDSASTQTQSGDLGPGLTEPRTPAPTVPAVPATPSTPATPVAPTPPPSLTPGAYTWSFNESPPAPVPFDEPGWDVQLYSRDRDTWYDPEPMEAHHAADCAGFPGVHRIARYDEMVFRCRNHIMTAVNASGYGAIVLTPDRLLDWSAGEAIIRFDISTFQSSPRDWINIFVSPFATHLPVPATPDAPGLNGPPRDGLYFEQASNGNLCARFVRNFVVTRLDCPQDWRPLTEKLVVSAVRRNTVEIRISRTHVKLWMPNDSIVFADADLPSALPFSEGVVQFGHYSYNPRKDCAVAATCVPNTWHWDEVYLSPSVAFTILRGSRRFVDGAGGTVTFASAAPSGASLQFFAAGVAPDVSFDNGATWQAPVEQGSTKLADPERQYWIPVPVGSASVRFRPGRLIAWWTERNSWMARDFAIWAH